MHTIALKFYCILLLIFISHNVNGKEQHNEKINIDLIVEAKHILTMDASNTILENSSIAINEGLIIEIADIRQINAKYTSDNHILGENRILPETNNEDYILIENGGAYGYTMSSNYNLRPPADEFIIKYE